MTNIRYRRLAEMAVEMYGHEKTFDYEPLVEEDRAPMIKAFQELGCDVATHGRILRVHCPDQHGETLN